MSKVKKSRRRNRCQPTGLPSLKEAEDEAGEQEAVEETTLPLLEKLLSAEDGEREWACHSVAHLVCEPEAQHMLLNHQGLPHSLIPLLLDREWAVREAAAGALRNLSAVGGESVCESLVRCDVVTALSAMLKECVSQLQTHEPSENPTSSTVVFPTPTPSPSPSLPPSDPPSSPLATLSATLNREGKVEGRGGRGGEEGGGVSARQLLAAAEQGMHLLLNISESSSVVVGVANHELLVLVLLHFLQPSLFTPHILTTAAMCLYTLTEDNPPSHHLITSTPSHMAQLETLLLPPPSLEQAQSHMLVVATATAGVFQHLLPSLSSPLPVHLASSVFTVLGAVLDRDITPLLHTLTSTPPHTPPQTEGATAATHSQFCRPTSEHESHVVEEVENVLSAQLLALEVIANFCYTENEEGEGEWEDVEEEEVIGGDVEREEDEVPMEQDSQQQVQLPGWLTAVLVEVGMVERVWRKCSPLVTPSLPQPLSPHLSALDSRWRTLQTRGFAALQNLLSALPQGSRCNRGGMVAMWQRVIELVGSGGVAVCDDVTGLLVVLARAMEDVEVQCVSAEHLQVLSAVYRERCGTTQHQLSADIILVMATVGRRSLTMSLPIKTPLLQVVGETLRDCVSCAPCEWVRARALDALYDVFGADECPAQLFSSLQIMPILENAAYQFTARVHEKKDLGVHYAEVISARDNLRPFIEYMNSRITTQT